MKKVKGAGGGGGCGVFCDIFGDRAAATANPNKSRVHIRVQKPVPNWISCCPGGPLPRSSPGGVSGQRNPLRACVRAPKCQKRGERKREHYYREGTFETTPRLIMLLLLPELGGGGSLSPNFSQKVRASRMFSRGEKKRSLFSVRAIFRPPPIERFRCLEK